ncbi:MAG: hypothetical protein ACTJHV_07005, partial [Cellulosimicrobium funkei]
MLEHAAHPGPQLGVRGCEPVEQALTIDLVQGGARGREQLVGIRSDLGDHRAGRLERSADGGAQPVLEE